MNKICQEGGDTSVLNLLLNLIFQLINYLFLGLPPAEVTNLQEQEYPTVAE